MTKTKTTTHKVKQAETQLAEATAALEAHATVASDLHRQHSEAGAIVAGAKPAALAATAPTDAAVKHWNERRAAADWLLAKVKEADAETARLQAIVDEKRATLEHEIEAVRLAQIRAANEARLGELLPAIARSREQMAAKHVASFLAVERQMSAAEAELQSDIASDAALRAEATRVAAHLGVEIALPPETVRAHVLALVAVAEDRAPVHAFVQLPRAPEQPHKRLEHLCSLLSEQHTPFFEKEWPFADRIGAVLAFDGTYRARVSALKAARSAETRRIAAVGDAPFRGGKFAFGR